MRITDADRFNSALGFIQSNARAVDKASRQISTGKRFLLPSEDPIAAAEVTRIRAQIDEYDSYTRSIDDAQSWYDVQDSTLQSASRLMTRVNELIVQAQNGAMGPASRGAIADEIDALRQQLGTLANTQVGGQAVFGGFANAAVQLTAAGANYVGTAGGAQVHRRVSPDLTLSVNSDGERAFGFTAGDNVFAVLSRVSAAVRAGDSTAIAGEATNVEQRTAELRDALGSIGARASALGAAKQLNEERTDSLKVRRSSVEDVDIASASVDLVKSQRAYDAALAAIARINQSSLLNFLR